MTNLAGIVTETAERIPDGIAYKLDDVEVNWQAVDEGSARVAGLLKEKGIEPGDRVGIMLPNVPYFPIAYYGVLRAGGTVVPMNVLLKGREVKFYLEDPEAKLVFAWHDFAEAAEKGAEEAGTEVVLVKPGEFEKLLGDAEPERDVVDRDGDDTAVILYTSGTTGQPKGAELTHDNMLKNAQASRDLFGIDADEIVLGALPLFHSFGQTCCMNACALCGATLTFIPRFDPAKALEIIERDKVTLFAGVPTMYNAMLNDKSREERDHSSLRICCSGGSAMPGELMRGFEKAFDCKILEGYGLSRDLAGRLLQPPRQGAQGRLHRHPDRGRRDEGGRRRRQRGRAGRGRRDRHQGPQRHEGLLEPRGRHRRRRSSTAGSTPATWPRWTRTATSSSSTARRS